MLWLTARDILVIHRAQLAEHGGLPGIKDENALESTLARPQQVLHYNPEAKLFELGASLGYGFAKNHVFNDGNKRVAFMSMFTFLGANDWRLNVPEPEAVSITLGVAASEISEIELTAWLHERCQPWVD